MAFLLISFQLISARDYFISNDPNRLQLSDQDSYTIVRYQGTVNLSTLIPQDGAPDLPLYTYRIILPGSATVDTFFISGVREHTLEGSFFVQPQQKLWSEYGTSQWIPPDPHLYASKHPFPQQIVKYLGIGHFNGLTVAQFAVFPIRYIAGKRRLSFVDQFQLSVITKPSEQTGVQPFLTFDQDQARQLIETGTQQTRFQLNKVNSVDHQPSPQDLSSGLIDRYIIITTEALQEALQPLAEWKTSKGVPTLIRTLSWIRQNFPDGVDDAERMRNFIRWAYEKRGLKYVLLAGDTDIIPTRVIHTGDFTFAADYYFSDLDGDWNANGNDVFGEVEDQLDAYPEVYVARIPIETEEDAQGFIKKLFQYEKLSSLPADSDYPANVLYMASNLSRENDGRDMINKHIDPQINPDFPRRMITESGEIGHSPDVPMAELNKNYGIIFSESHGAYFTIRPGANGSNIYSYQLYNLHNSLPPIWYIASCYTNDILKRSFSEMYLLSQHGGVAYIGNSSWEYPFSGIYLEKEFFNQVFNKGNYHLAQAHFLSRYPYLGYLNWEGPTRIIVFSTTVLGDPEMPVWTEKPRKLKVSYSEYVFDNQPHLWVSVSDSSDHALNDATIVLYKRGSTYKILRSNPEGIVSIPIEDVHTDSLYLTVTKHNYIPFQKFISLHNGRNPGIQLTRFSLNEEDGNGDDLCQPGETFDVNLTIHNGLDRNLGAGLKINLNTANPYISFSPDSLELQQSLAPQDSLQLGPVQMFIATGMPADTTILTTISFEENERILDERQRRFPVTLPDIGIYELCCFATTTDGSENISTFQLKLINRGQGMARNIRASLRAQDSSIQVLDSSASFGSMASEQIVSGSNNFTIQYTKMDSSSKFRLTIKDYYDHTQTKTLDLVPPQIERTLGFKPADDHDIELNWPPSPTPDIYGYHIFRRPHNTGSFEQITYQPMTMAGYFVDDNVEPNSFYDYYVVAIDSSGNLSHTTTDTLTAWPAVPALAGFPIFIGARGIGSGINGVITADINGDHLPELIVSGSHGLLSVYSDRGVRQFDTPGLDDANLTVPALGNVYGDSHKEIVVSGYNEGKLGNSISIISSENGQRIGKIDLGYHCPTSVVLKDLNGDGYDDIIVLAHAGNAPQPPKTSNLFIFRSSGSGWETFPGWPEGGYAFSTGYALGAPAAADLDHSGRISVLTGAGNKLYCFHPTQSAEPIWIRTLKGNLNMPISLADLNKDRNLEIVVGAVNSNKLYVLNHLGQPMPGWENGQPVDITDPYGHSSPAVIGNLDEDPELEIAYVGRQHVYLFNADSTLLPHWPVAVKNGESSNDPYWEKLSPFNSPVLADLDQDGSPEIIFVTSYGVLHALNCKTGRDISGFPYDTGNDQVQGQSPLVDDIDRDGDLDVLFINHEGMLYAWDTPHKYNLATQLYWNQVQANIRHTGELDTTHIEVVSGMDAGSLSAVPKQFYLKQNYPNPFNPLTEINFQLSDKGRVNLSIYDILGQKVATLISGQRPAGQYTVTWQGRNDRGFNVHSGVYFYRLTLTSGGQTLYSHTRKMIYLK